PIETVGPAAQRPGELAEGDDADEEALAGALGRCEESTHPFALRRIVGGERAQQDAGVETPHASPRRILSSSSTGSRASSRSRASAGGGRLPGRRSTPSSSR